MNDVTGMPQTAVVIGGGSDIAAAVLRLLAARRLRAAVLAGRDLGALEKAAAELEALGVSRVEVRELDVTNLGAQAAFAKLCADTLGSIDLVLVAAGVLGSSDLAALDPIAAAREITTNFVGPAAAMIAFAAILRSQGYGRIVVLSSVAGVRVRKANFVYGSAKAGLDGFSLGLDDALEGSGAHVTVVRPGFVYSKMTAGLPPAPLSVTPEQVASEIVRGLETGAGIVWVPSPLRWLAAVMSVLPRSVWRRLPR